MNEVRIDDRVVVQCPECVQMLPVGIVVTIEEDEEGQMVTSEPDLSKVWTHMRDHAS